MDERKEEGGSVGNVSESTVTAGEHVAGERETLAESMDCEVQGQAEAEGVVEEGGGSCNGDDIMVEVLGSRVYVDGICTSDGGAGENPNDEGGCGNDGPVEGAVDTDVRSLDGEGCAVDGVNLRGIEVSGGEASANLGTETGVQEPGPVREEGFEGKLEEECTEGGRKTFCSGKIEVVDDTEVQDIEDRKDEAQSGGDGAGPEESSLVSMGGETQVVNVEKVAVLASEGDLKGDVGKEGVEKDIADVTEETQVLAVEEVAANLKGDVGKDGVEKDIADVTEETQVLAVKEVAANVSEDGEGKKLIEKGAEQGREMNDDGRDALQESEAEKIDVLNDEVQDPGNENAVANSSAVVEASIVHSEVVGEETATVTHEEGSHPKYDGPGNDSIQGIVSGSDRSQTSVVETSCGGAEQDSSVNECPNEQTHVTAGAKDMEEAMQIDAADGSSSHPTEQLLKVEKADCSTEDSDSVSADTGSVHHRTEAIVGAASADMDGEELPILEKDQSLKVEKCLDHSTTHGLAYLDPNTGQDMEIDKQDSEQQQETVNNGAGGIISGDSTNTDQSTQEAVRGEVEAVDYNVLLDPNFDVSNYIDFDGMLSCPGNVQHIKADAVCAAPEIGSEVEEVAVMDNQEVLKPDFEVQEPAERDQESGLDQADPNTVEEVEIEKQVNVAEQLSSHVEQDLGVKEQLVKAETVGVSTEDHGNICVDSVSLGQETHVIVEAECGTVDGMVPNDACLSGNLDRVQSCSGNDQIVMAETVCGSMKVDTQIMDGREVLGPAQVDQEGKAGECLDKSTVHDLSAGEADTGQAMVAEEEQVVSSQPFGLHDVRETEFEEQGPDTEQPEASNEETVKQSAPKVDSLVKAHQATYQLPPEDEGEFSVSDLVWGKVRSHPWWPGEIFDSSDASEKATKYHKKDCFLVAYFGDRTFAWNEASLLKHFRAYFSQVEKQSNSEAFQNAVDCALEEVSRRVELGLACSCIPEDVYNKIRFQIVENSGIRQESSMRDGLGKSVSANSLEPHNLVEYVKALAQSPSGGADRLELVIAKAQLLAFYRLKGYYQLPEFQFCGTLLEKNSNTSLSEDKMDLDDVFEHETPLYKNDQHNCSGQGLLETQRSSYHKRKHNLKDGLYHSKKERSLSELMGETLESADGETGPDGRVNNKLVSAISGKKRKAVDSFDDDSLHEGRKTISLAKVSVTTPNFPKPSFKIGECIRRAASQMTGSPSILKCSPAGDGSDVPFDNFGDTQRKGIIPAEYSSLDELLSQLHLAARDPMKGYSFLNIIISFFADFRNSTLMDRLSADKAGAKRKRSSNSIIGSPEAFEFEDMNDTYWTDRIIQNGSEEQPSGGKGGFEIVPVDLGKPVQKSRRSYSRKRYSDGNHDVAAERPPGYVDENSPAELIMNFSEMDTIPSETNLSKMFRHFGPIRESETEVDRDTSRARVVFKKSADAQVAFNSAGKFSIFGQMVVSYQLSYSISEPFKISPIATSFGEEDAT